MSAAVLASVPRSPAWVTIWELRAATGLSDSRIHAELRRQIGALRVRASMRATCWQRPRAKGASLQPNVAPEAKP